MTIKEIAELCGVRVMTVYRWIEKAESLNNKMLLRKQIDEGSPERPADFTLEETLAIIGDGGKNTTLASLLEENAASKALTSLLEELKKNAADKDALVIYDMQGKNIAALERIAQFIRDKSAAAVTESISDIRARKHTQSILCGKTAECYRYAYESGGRVYAIPTTKCWTKFSVLVYDSGGKCLREGIAVRDSLFETIEGLVREYGMGKFLVCKRVDSADFLDWRFSHSLSKPWGKLLPPRDSILEFKPEGV
jgi:hypothetical protein